VGDPQPNSSPAADPDRSNVLLRYPRCALGGCCTVVGVDGSEMGWIFGIGGGTRGDATAAAAAVVATADEAVEDEDETLGLVSILRTGAIGRARGGVTDFEGGGAGLLKNVGGGVGVGVGAGAAKLPKRDAPLALGSARAVGAAMDGGGGVKLGIVDVVVAAAWVVVLGVPLVVVVGKVKG
jgi:hypothetical protein